MSHRSSVSDKSTPFSGMPTSPTTRGFFFGDGGHAVGDFTVSFEKPRPKEKPAKGGRFFNHGDGGHPVHSHVPLGTHVSLPELNLPRKGGGFKLPAEPPSFFTTRDFSPGFHGYIPVMSSKKRLFMTQVQDLLDKEGLVLKTGRRALTVRAMEVILGKKSKSFTVIEKRVTV